MLRLKIRDYAVAVVLLSFVESALIAAGIIPPVFSYSWWNLLFSFLRLALIAHAGFTHSENGPLHCARCGAVLGLSYSLALCLASAASLALFQVPVLGMPYTNLQTYAFTLAILVVQNVALGAAVAIVSASLDGAFRQHSSENRPGHSGKY
ncbi:MAG: hypothetical protein WC506_04415 [Candidatus Micrarchaeia archaeon]